MPDEPGIAVRSMIYGRKTDVDYFKNERTSRQYYKKTGCITSILDKRRNSRRLRRALRQPTAGFKDTPKDYDAWNIDPGTLDHRRR